MSVAIAKQPEMKADNIIAVVPEYAAGPGWANTPIWIYYRDDNGSIHQDCLQPEEQTKEMLALFSVAATAHAELLKYVKKSMG